MSGETPAVREALPVYEVEAPGIERVPPGYMQTEVGVIPEDWSIKPFGHIIDLLTGYPFPSSQYSRSGVRLVRGSNVKRGLLDWSDDITEYWPSVTTDISQYELQDGDLVVAMDGALVGRSYAVVAQSDLPCLLLQRVARIRSHSVHAGLLAYMVGNDSFVKYVDSVKTHTAIPHISPADIRDFILAVPSDPAEQRAIAAALSDVDALISALDKLIAKKRAVKAAAMQQLLTGKQRLPGFSGEWGEMSLGMVADIIDPHPSHRAPPEMEYGIPFVGIGDISVDGEINKDTVRLVNESIFDEHTMRYDLNDGLIGIGRVASIGKVVRLSLQSGKFAVSPTIAVINARSADTDFLFYYLSSQAVIDQFDRISSGSTRQSVGMNVLRGVQISLPLSLAEQTAIAAVLSDMDAEIEALEARREKTRQVKQGMMQELLTGRTRLV